jgi:hypothetical protein
MYELERCDKELSLEKFMHLMDSSGQIGPGVGSTPCHGQPTRNPEKQKLILQ